MAELPTDDEILSKIARRRADMLRAWDAAEVAARQILADKGITASEILFSTDFDSGRNTIGEDHFMWTDADGKQETLWGEGDADKAWEGLAGLLEDLAGVIVSTVGTISRRGMENAYDHDIALTLFGVEDEDGNYLEDESPIYRRFVEIDSAR